MSLNAVDVKEALRARHPAVVRNGSASWAGAWTCLEEWMNIDLLAVSAWATVCPYPRYARIGYEVKVSRSDYKRELARPGKRAAAVAFCHEFYFAIPRGLLKPEEIAWTPPWGFDRERAPFERQRCYGLHGTFCNAGVLHGFGAVDPRSPRDLYEGRGRYASRIDYTRAYNPRCPVCGGRGWIAESPVVRAGAPKLWIPDDVGLVLVEENGKTIVAKKAPRRASRNGAGADALAYAYGGPKVELSDSQLADLVRWVSVRPDPRHAGLRDAGTPPAEGLSSAV